MTFKSETIGKLAEALAKAQGEMDNAKKDSNNPFFKSKYADLASNIDSIKGPLSKHGLSYVQFTDEENEKNYLITKLMHSSGEWISGRLKLILKQNDMQGLGSAITYARRYGLAAMVGLAQEDDDGNEASGKINQESSFKGQSYQKSSFKPNIVQSKPQEEWKIREEELNHIKQLADNVKWPVAAISSYIRNNFKKEKASDLTKNEYDQFCKHLIETSS